MADLTVSSAIDTFMGSANLAAMRNNIGLAALGNAESLGWSDALLSRLAANSVGLGARLSITAPANASALSTTGYSLTGSNAQSMIDLAGTLNTTGSPAIIKVAMSNTASGATTKFLTCLAGASGTTEVASINKAGDIFCGQVSASTIFATSVRPNTLILGGSTDIFFERDAANTLALRNAANAQAFNIYNTYTSGSVYERGFMRWVSNVLEIGTEHTGASTRDLVFKTNNTERMRFGASGTMTVAGGVSTAFFDVITYFASASAATSRSSAGNGFTVGSAYQYLFSSTTGANGSADVGLGRTIAGVVGVTNGSTGAGALGLVEMTSPAAPATNGVYIFAEDNGSGKTRLMARFATGATQQLAIEP